MAFPARINLASLDGITGFRLDGTADSDQSGSSVASAGDVNGDGFDDLIIGAFGADPNGNSSAGSSAGSSYVVFGKAGGFNPTLDLSTLDGTTGFRLDGVATSENSGRSVASAGDVNGDGFADIIVGAANASPNNEYNAGSSYLVFGKASGFAPSLTLSSLDGANGFRLDGTRYDNSGRSVASAGDVNGDGFDDLIVGAPLASSNGSAYAGSCYVVFGKAGGFLSSLDLASLDGTNGFRLDGASASDRAGFSVASAGDVNGDGVDDLLVGAYGADPNGNGSAGSSYVVFGKTDGFTPSLNLSSLSGTDGFRLDGAGPSDLSGRSLASAGDVNGDGFDDLIVGAEGASPNGSYSGSTYVVFGKAGGFTPTLDLSTLNGSTGFRLDGASNEGSAVAVASAGDINGDGFDDLIVGAPNGDVNFGMDVGASYVVFGKAGGFTPTLALSTLNGTTGFRINGDVSLGNSGRSVASAGDVNADGFDDLIIGAPGANPNNNSNAGSSYVIFGRETVAPVVQSGSVNGVTLTLTYNEALDAASVPIAGDFNVEADGQIVAVSSVTVSGSLVTLTLASAVANDQTVTIDYTDPNPASDDIGSVIQDAIGNDAFSFVNQVVENVTVAPTAPPSGGGGGAPTPTPTPTILIGTDSPDTLNGTAGSDTAAGGSGNDTLLGNQGNDSLNGNQGNDTVRGGQGNDLVRGGQGDDVIQGDRGNDQMFGDNGNDTVNGNQGTDSVNGGMGNDIVHGGQDDDEVRGGQGDDFVFGDRGNDAVWGDLGNDTLSGGAGADTFRFVSNSGNDIIVDYSRADGDALDFGGQAFTVADVNGSALFALSGGGTVVLTGVSAASLDAGDFV